MCQSKTAENRVQSIEKSAAYTSEKACSCHADVTTQNAAYKHTACKGHDQSNKFFPGYLILENQSAHNHNKNRACVQQNCRYRKGTLLLTGKIQKGEQHNTHKACAQKVWKMFKFYAENVFVHNEKQYGHNNKTAKVSYHNQVAWGESYCRKIAGEKPKHTPGYARNKYKYMWKIFFHNKLR